MPAALKNDARHVSGVPSVGACCERVLGVCPLPPSPTPPHAWGPSNAHIDRSLLHQQGHFQGPGAAGEGRPTYFLADGGCLPASSFCGKRPGKRSPNNNEACLCMLSSIEACLCMLSSIYGYHFKLRSCRCSYTHMRSSLRVCAMQETPRRHPGHTQEAPRRQPGPGGTQEAPRRHPGGTQEAPKRHPKCIQEPP